MSDEIDEVVTIAIMSNGDESIRTITNEYEQSDTCWPHLVEVFLEQLQGLGYSFVSTPDKMAEVLNEFHDRCVHEKYACNEAPPVVEEKNAFIEEGSKEYPYTGVYKRDGSYVLVEFIAPMTGKCIYSTAGSTGEYSTNWAEEDFEKVSK